MLANWERVRPLLACPACGAGLAGDAAALRCTGPACRLAAEGAFGTVRGQPVLVDWDESILSRDDVTRSGAAPVVPFRQNVLKTWLKDHALRSGAVELARRNARAFTARLEGIPGRSPLLLVVGGGTQGIGTDALYQSPGVEVVGFDVYASERTHLVADAHAIPLRDGSVDAVWIQYVLEHVLDPWRVVAEIHRVLRPGGLVYAETPFLQHVHANAYDFTRFTHSGHRWLFRDFTEEDSGIAMGAGVQLLWTVEHLARGVTGSRTMGKAVKLAASAAQMVEQKIPYRFQRDSASSFYFVGRKSHARLRPRDMVAYYEQSAP
ncbi:MAG TPA: class I SAM-dependent methyltransferase [Longimicrobium sp.]|nr:class I SAM-dependent methyltransferase [Longimicrobium sp.]